MQTNFSPSSNSNQAPAIQQDYLAWLHTLRCQWFASQASNSTQFSDIHSATKKLRKKMDAILL
jgi:hypothetical protein